MTDRITYTPDPGLSYWPTPPDVADDLVHWVMEPWHALGDGVRVLEPSAGDGHLARAIRARLPEAHITAVEPDPGRAAGLRATGVADVTVEGTLEDYLNGVAVAAAAGDWRPFHLAIANPPFTLPGRPEVWAEHVLALYHDPHALAPGGVIAAVVPRIVMTGQSKLVRAVRDLLQPAAVADRGGHGYGGAEPCDRAAFAPVGAQVSAALIWAQKPHRPE